jgi:hypothetical protein
MPLKDSSADAVVASPPYCTRIDYVVGTLPELAVLGADADGIRALRRRMIGTPTVHRPDDGWPERNRWGATATHLLDVVAAHPSRASATYYLNFYLQYLNGMWRSLKEVARVTRTGSPVVLVAQDSYYKEQHVDLPQILTDMGRELEWRNAAHHTFKVPTKAWLNQRARQYRDDRSATESVLVFET